MGRYTQLQVLQFRNVGLKLWLKIDRKILKNFEKIKITLVCFLKAGDQKVFDIQVYASQNDGAPQIGGLYFKTCLIHTFYYDS